MLIVQSQQNVSLTEAEENIEDGYCRRPRATVVGHEYIMIKWLNRSIYVKEFITRSSQHCAPAVNHKDGQHLCV